MRTTLRDRVVDVLAMNYPYTMTNAGIARELGAPEPSVRRATRELTHRADIVESGGGYGNIPVQYQAVEPVLPNADGR